ncbi:carbon storage regulator [Blastopirellula retiformator]|uniref:Carbon storage regulator n=1 Tax=Blastopirellula retiformator TaxID=2527970 RepID=A0A5C5UXW6_9BACT|nr:carbon storage regulator [Blastopirellula retiformator]TWT30679.1 carbon storage regulator [Blastopirellula retiformator]
MFLVLSRHVNEPIVFDFDKVIRLIDTNPEEAKESLRRVSVMPFAIRGDKVRFSIDAHKNVSVHRQEVMDAIDRENKQKQDQAEV